MTKLIRISLTALLCLCPLALRAQSHEPAPAAEKTAEKHVAPAAEGHGAEAGHEAQHEAHGETAHAAAGHEAGNAHHGPAMTLFGKTYGNGGAFLVQLLNFAIYGAGLFFMLKGALSAMFKTRREELVTMLAQAEKDKAEGEAQMKDMEAKMSGLETELAGILAKAESDSEAEKQRVLEAAKAEAAQILAQAQAEIGFQKRQAEQELRALVAELAVEGAAKRLEAKLHGPDSAKAANSVIDRAIQQIGGVQ
ncbi:MAG: ATP synthase F0 subunit B [Acidobacteria bacterium]|nr:ATP synthase F0 subunit B [Acidobacteriota bacterium]MBI3486760.1 ATP synthase F0 subunit B [Acidobacteriota bacterium]